MENVDNLIGKCVWNDVKVDGFEGVNEWNKHFLFLNVVKTSILAVDPVSS